MNHSTLFRHGRKWAKAGGVDARLFHCFSPAEIRVLQALAKGYSNKEIADHTGSALTTVKMHLYQLALKAGLNTGGGREGGNVTRIKLAVAWCEYESQYKNCELFNSGLTAMGL